MFQLCGPYFSTLCFSVFIVFMHLRFNDYFYVQHFGNVFVQCAIEIKSDWDVKVGHRAILNWPEYFV